MTDRGTTRDVSHAHSDHDARGWRPFARGPALATDGGRPEDRERPAREGENRKQNRDLDRDRDRDRNRDQDRSRSRTVDGRDATRDPMRDVSHTPADGDGANRVWDGTRVYDEDAEGTESATRAGDGPRGGSDDE